MRSEIASMTGFSEARASSPRLEFTVTSRSVNHRFLDVLVRLPEQLRRYERDVLDRVRRRFERGRIEIRVELSPVEEAEVKIRINPEIVRGYALAVDDARTKGLLTGKLSAGEMLNLPDVVDASTRKIEFEQQDLEAFEKAVDDCLDDLATARSEEGRRLERAVRGVLLGLGEIVAGLETVSEGIQGLLFARLQERIERLLEGVELDRDRLALEVALLVEKSEIREELDRLRAHVESFGALLESEEAVGKRMDFLCQEILRELNTIASKCRDTEAVAMVLEGKMACEKLREQAQNLE